MVDTWMIIFTVVVCVLMLAVTIYLFILYSHPDDKYFGMAWWARIVIVSGYFIVWAFILLLPLDVANSRGEGGNFNMEFLYQLMFILYFVYIVAILPMTLLLYQSDDEKSLISRICSVLCQEVIIIVVVAVLSLIAWGFLRTMNFSDLRAYDIKGLQLSEDLAVGGGSQLLTNRIQYDIPSYLFVVIFLIFIGWFLFVVFGGVGLVALPLDMINDYFYRPQPRSAREMAEKKIALRTKCEELMVFSKQIEEKSEDLETEDGFWSKRKLKRSIGKKGKTLQKELYMLEEEYEIFEAEEKLTANPVWALIKMLLGCLLAIVSFLVWLHVLFFVIIHVNGKASTNLLNDVLIFFEFSLARFIGMIIFAALGLYLLMTTIKGNIKFGLRILIFFFPIYPMKLGRTYTNSFIFNLILVMLCVPAVIHFQIECFSLYMKLTSGVVLFSVILKRMKFFNIFWQYKVFFYMYIIWALLTLIYLLCKPEGDRMNIKKIIERRKKKY